MKSIGITVVALGTFAYMGMVRSDLNANLSNVQSAVQASQLYDGTISIFTYIAASVLLIIAIKVVDISDQLSNLID